MVSLFCLFCVGYTRVEVRQSSGLFNLSLFCLKCRWRTRKTTYIRTSLHVVETKIALTFFCLFSQFCLFFYCSLRVQRSMHFKQHWMNKCGSKKIGFFTNWKIASLRSQMEITIHITLFPLLNLTYKICMKDTIAALAKIFWERLKEDERIFF
jgi:hypothetical protein